MISYLIDQIPLWVYWTVGFLGVGAAFYFFSPILVPLWNITPNWVKISLGVILAILSAFIYGRNKGNKDAKDEQNRRDAGAVQKRQEIHDKVGKLSPADTDKRLDKWMRD